MSPNRRGPKIVVERSRLQISALQVSKCKKNLQELNLKGNEYGHRISEKFMGKVKDNNVIEIFFCLNTFYFFISIYNTYNFGHVPKFVCFISVTRYDRTFYVNISLRLDFFLVNDIIVFLFTYGLK